MNSIKTAKTLEPEIFLPYQRAWLKDKSQVKLWRKSRRIGATWTQAYEDVFDALTLKIRGKFIDVWFSSADITAAKEYIEYCIQWAKAFNIAFEDLGEQVIDEEKDVKALSIRFTNGARINALSSNPSQFRSKGGKIVLDEFAHHKDQQKLWTAAGASALIWGYPVRILSTDNGQSCKYFQFVKNIIKGILKWSMHTTTIYDAVEQGLADKVYGRALTEKERQEYIEYLHQNAGDEFTWQQEYCCNAIDESAAFLSYDLISTCTHDTKMPLENVTGDLFVGVDIGRKKDLTVISIFEKLGHVKYLRNMIVLKKMPFREQKKILYSVLRHPKFRRCCIDATGIGMQLAEDAQFDFGKYRVEALMFTAAVKDELACKLRMEFEDKTIMIFDDDLLREDLHSVKKVVTISGAVRFDVDASETDGHADRFWSIALGSHAAENKRGGNADVRTACPRNKNKKRFEFDYKPSSAVLWRRYY